MRIMTFGHSLEVIQYAQNDENTNQASNRIFNIAEALLSDMVDQRLGPSSKRPLIFLCQGIGGIIVKKALVIANARTSEYGSILSSAIHVIFLDTPHGGYSEDALQLITSGGINQEFTLWSHVLTELSKEFCDLAERMYFTSFFASLPIQTLGGEAIMVSGFRLVSPGFKNCH
jgi:hypothetical protein